MSTPAIVKLLIVTALSQIFQAQAEPVPWSSYEDLIPFDRRSVPILTEENGGFPWPLMDPSKYRDSLRTKRGRSSGSGKRRRNYLDPNPNFIRECVQVVASPGTYVVRSGEQSSEACGVYIAGLHDEEIIVDISFVDVTCRSGGLVAFFDGWEMNGHIFPSEYDHKLHLNERVVQLCKETFPRSHKLRLRSSQNVALLQYKIPQAGQGFIFRVSMTVNKDPCNVLVTEDQSLFTLNNNGMARNCSLTAVLSPPNLKLVQFGIGEPMPDDGLKSLCSSEDYMDVGGASNLDPARMEVKESICGREPEPAKMGLTILCDSSSVRLVSSGKFENSVTVHVQEARDEDMNYDKNIVMMCPGYI